PAPEPTGAIPVPGSRSVPGTASSESAAYSPRHRREQPLDARVPGNEPRDVAARAAERARFVLVLAQPAARARELVDRRSDDKARLAVAHDVERAAGVDGCDHRLLREERLVWDEAVVLVDRRVVDAEAAPAAARVPGGRARSSRASVRRRSTRS